MKGHVQRCRKCGVGFVTKDWGVVRCAKCERIVDGDGVEGIPVGEALMVGAGIVVFIAAVVLAYVYWG
jgi:hypothetical protein